jgi:hypothetical protein
MALHNQIPGRGGDKAAAISKATDYRNAKLKRDHEVELLLNAGVPLEEAIALCPNPVMA